MKIISLHVVSFGKLQNVQLTLNPNLNIIQQNNSFGKTTMAAFIRTMLYGFNYSRTKSGNDVSAYTNWKGNSAPGGSMVVEHNGITYRIERFAGNSARTEKLTILNVQTGTPVSMLPSVGEYLLGLTAESYDRSAYYPQEFVEMSSNDNLDNKLAGIVQNQQDVDAVLSKLRAKRKDYKFEKGNGGIIYTLNNRIDNLHRQIDRCQSAGERQKQIDTQLEKLAAQRKQLKAEWENNALQAESIQKQIGAITPDKGQEQNQARLKELEEKLLRVGKDFSQNKSQCDLLAQQIAKTPDAAKPQRAVSKPLLIVGIILAVIGVGLCCVQVKGLLIAGIIAAVIGAALAVVAFFVKPSLKTMQAGEKDALITQYYSLASRYINCSNMQFDEVQKALWQAYNEYTGDLRVYEMLKQQTASSSGSAEEAKELSQKLRLLQLRQEQIRQETESQSTQVGALTEERKNLSTDALPYVEELQEAQLQLVEAQKQYDNLGVVMQLLQRAKDNLSTSYLPALYNRSGELLNKITDGNYQMVVDRNFSVQLCYDGVTKPLYCFSRGIREITMTCFRVALSELLFNGQIPLLILDDAFVNFDEENFLRATELVNNLFQNTQVVYFTCHNRLGKLKQQSPTTLVTK